MLMTKGVFRKTFIVLLVLAGIVSYFTITWQKPPVDEIKLARVAVSEAVSMNANSYATILFRNANELYDSAIGCWQKENGKLFFLRDFSEVKRLAVLSGKMAASSIEKTRSAKKNISEMLSGEISGIEEELAGYDKVYASVPLEEPQRAELNRGKMLLKEGILAFERQNYYYALEKIDSAEVLVGTAIDLSARALENYFSDYRKWKQWSEKFLASSRRNQTTCIIIDKTGRTCNVYKNGNHEASYPVELGTNWMGHKLCQGHMSTPEGFYKIVSKKSGGETNYYKALLLNYPNEDDKKQFVSNKKNGIIPKDALIGGLIEIHGYGGKGADWTNGCIALGNRDMDSIYSICTQGTEVLIIGSLKPLEDIL
jgi:hypothetical protein